MHWNEKLNLISKDFIHAETLFKMAGTKEYSDMDKFAFDNPKIIHDLNTPVSEEIKDKFFDLIVKNLSQGKDVKLPGFGSIKIQERKPRLGRNPTTGEPIQIAQRKAIVFRPSKDLKKRLNSLRDDGEL